MFAVSRCASACFFLFEIEDVGQAFFWGRFSSGSEAGVGAAEASLLAEVGNETKYIVTMSFSNFFEHAENSLYSVSFVILILCFFRSVHTHLMNI